VNQFGKDFLLLVPCSFGNNYAAFISPPSIRTDVPVILVMLPFVFITKIVSNNGHGAMARAWDFSVPLER
jgi:hypothetical protein